MLINEYVSKSPFFVIVHCSDILLLPFLKFVVHPVGRNLMWSQYVTIMVTE